LVGEDSDDEDVVLVEQWVEELEDYQEIPIQDE